MSTRDDLENIEREIEQLEDRVNTEDPKYGRSLRRELEKLYNERAKLKQMYKREQEAIKKRIL